MPSIEITDNQHERFAALREELAAAHAGEYASVQPSDVIAYLLDVAEAADTSAPVPGGEPETGTDTTTAADAEGTRDTDPGGHSGSGVDTNGDGGTADALGGGPGMLNLLEEHDEKWREADGDTRYEVDLPDGGTETARTRDDVKAVLFKHY
jgi:hypothetical protein